MIPNFDPVRGLEEVKEICICQHLATLQHKAATVSLHQHSKFDIMLTPQHDLLCGTLAETVQDRVAVQDHA